MESGLSSQAVTQIKHPKFNPWSSALASQLFCQAAVCTSPRVAPNRVTRSVACSAASSFPTCRTMHQSHVKLERLALLHSTFGLRMMRRYCAGLRLSTSSLRPWTLQRLGVAHDAAGVLTANRACV